VEKSSENSVVTGKHDTLIRESSEIGLEDWFVDMIRLWNLAEILGDSGQYEHARKKEQKAIEIIRKRLKEKPSYMQESQTSLIPLLLAARIGYSEAVALVLVNDIVYLNVKDWHGQTPLLWAARKGHEAVVKLLLETSKVDVESMHKSGQTPLSWAARDGHEAVVKLLLETGNGDVKSTDRFGQTPLGWADRNRHEAVAKLLEPLTLPNLFPARYP
jgi:ankyrin repeat protein